MQIEKFRTTIFSPINSPFPKLREKSNEKLNQNYKKKCSGERIRTFSSCMSESDTIWRVYRFATPEQLYSDRIELICMYIGHDEPNLFLEGAVTI